MGNGFFDCPGCEFEFNSNGVVITHCTGDLEVCFKNMTPLSKALATLPDTDQNVVSVLSGGLDSTIMTYILVKKYGKERVYALSYNYGQKQVKELEMAAKTCQHLGIPHKVLDLGILGDIVKDVSANIGGTDVAMPTIKDVLGDPQPKTYVPFRNMILNALAFSFAESNKASHVFTGLQVHDEYGYWDTTQKFVDCMNAVADQNRTHKVKLLAPFSLLSKYDEIMISKELDDVRLEHTLTCYNPDAEGNSCGICPSCSERIQNFIKAGVRDPIPYRPGIDWDRFI
jgi:7-cyano-7-deazaguanine synthase